MPKSQRWRVCSIPGCPEYTDQGGRCAEHRREAERRRGSARQRGYGRRHEQRFRPGVLARDPRCVCTGDCGAHAGLCAAVSNVADHHPVERVDLVAMGQDPNEPDHGRGVCAPCHDRKTARTKPAGWAAR